MKAVVFTRDFAGRSLKNYGSHVLEHIADAALLASVRMMNPFFRTSQVKICIKISAVLYDIFVHVGSIIVGYEIMTLWAIIHKWKVFFAGLIPLPVEILKDPKTKEIVSSINNFLKRKINFVGTS